MSTVYQYRFLCLPTGGSTASATEHLVWDIDEPTSCPTDNSLHYFDANSISIVNKVEESSVTIEQETVKTGGNIQVLGKQFQVTATGVGDTQIFDFTLPMSINLSSVEISTYSEQKGDNFNFQVAPNTTIGILAASVVTGSTGITVTDTVIDNIMIGYFLTITDGVNLENTGQVISIDKLNNRIILENPLTTSFSALSPTYVQMTINLGVNIYLGYGNQLRFGDDKIGTSYIPANTTIRCVYYNGSGGPKVLTAFGSYLY